LLRLRYGKQETPTRTAQADRVEHYKIAARQVWLGAVEASDQREAIEKAAKEFNQPRS